MAEPVNEVAEPAETVDPATVAPLFRPLDLGPFALANRIVMSPMTRNFSPGGVPGEDVAAYYRRRAEGGTGLIVTEATAVDHPGALGDAGLGEHGTPELVGEAALAGWRRVVEGVHAAGARIFPQLWHMGVMKRSGTGPFPDYAANRPSGLWGPQGGFNVLKPDYLESVAEPTRPMADHEIADIISAFARCAANAKAVGFDGIAVHGAHGYLIDTFFWGETNRRPDRFGGDMVERTRFAVEVLKAIRAEIGPDMPIHFRYSQWKAQDFKARLAETPQALEAFLAPLTDAGVDIYDVSTRLFHLPEFEGSDLGLAGWTKKLTGRLVSTVGGVGLRKGPYDPITKPPSTWNNLDMVMERFARGEFDLVSVGRSLVNDPAWTRRLRDGEPLLPFDPASLRVLT